MGGPQPAISSASPAEPVVAASVTGPVTGTAVTQIEAKIAAGEVDAALALARTAKDDGTAASAGAWAHAAFAAGRFAEAHDAALAWMSRAPQSLQAQLVDARALRAAGRHDEARARLVELLAKHPSCAEAKTMLKDLELLEPAKPTAKPAKAKHPKKKGPQKLLG
jgi:predicted Zn-dependent protease